MLSLPLVRGGLVLSALLLSGCASLQLAARNEAVDRALLGGDYQGAALIAEGRMGLDNAAGSDNLPPVRLAPRNVLDHLEAAEAWRMAGRHDRAIAHFDAAESALQQVELQGLVSGGGQQLGAVLLSDSVLSYVPSPAEAVLINYYKALSFLSSGQPDLARVELNRADDRTRRAVDRYAAEITAAQREAERENAGASYGNTSVRGLVQQRFPEMAQWSPYAEFIVPPAAYLQALFLSRSTDPTDQEKARTLFERVLGVTHGHGAVAQDAQDAERGRTCPADDCIWVLAEYGQGPSLEERRVMLPIQSREGLITVTLALPALVSRAAVAPPFQLMADGAPLPLPLLASMDRVIQTEFQKRFPAIVTRALLSATAKAVAQEAVNRNAGPLAGLAMNIAAMASTSADVRMWRAMPGAFALTRVPRRQAQQLVLQTGTAAIPITLPARGACLVHLKMPSPQAAPRIDVLPL